MILYLTPSLSALVLLDSQTIATITKRYRERYLRKAQTTILYISIYFRLVDTIYSSYRHLNFSTVTK